MKKALLLLASAALLLVGCSKEQVAGQQDGGMTTASFTANFDNGDATKAVADNDGKGTNVNRCIMEIYFQNQLYKRMVEPAVAGVATFANVPVVAGKEYQILFWADCGGAEKSDLYYTTTSLKAVTVAKTAFIGALVAGDNDKLDAFFFAGDYTVPQGGGSYDVTLKRPFAQLNVITTDVGEGKTVFEEDMLPEKDSVSYTAANAINVATGEVSGTETYAYEADVYGEWSTVATNHELTLSMDYILASAEQGAVDVTFITKNNGAAVMTHNLTNLPYQRNYRTNIKGALLTTTGDWTATILPGWNTPDEEVKFVEAGSVAAANEAFANGATSVKITSVGDEKTLYLPQTTKEVTLDFANPSDTITLSYGPAPVALFATKSAVENKPAAVNIATNDITKFTVTGISNIVWLAGNQIALASALNNAVAGQTVALTNDIDLDGINWDSPVLYANFNGNGHIIKNIKNPNCTPDYAGLFKVSYSNIKNVTIQNAEFAYGETKNARGGALVGDMRRGSIENCHVDGIKFDGYQKVGGLVGFLSKNADNGSDISIKNCSVKNATFAACGADDKYLYQTGGLIGYIQLGNRNISISNCSVNHIIFDNTKHKGVYNVASDNSGYLSHTFVGIIFSDTNNAGNTLSFTANTISGENTQLNASMYGSAYFGWARNPEYSDETVTLGKITIDGEAWAPNYPVKIVGGQGYATLAEAITAATEGQTVQILKAGEYTFPGNTKKAIIVEGLDEKDADGNYVVAINLNGVSEYNENLTFKHLTFNFTNSEGADRGFTHCVNMTYNECVFTGLMWGYDSQVSTFNDCLFHQATKYNVWSYGGNLEFNRCLFQTSTGTIVNVYATGTDVHEVRFNDCTFESLNDVLDKGAILLKGGKNHGHVIVNNYTLKGKFQNNGDSAKYINSADGLYMFSLRDGDFCDAVYITVNGVTHYPYFTIDANGNYGVKNANGLKAAIKHWNALTSTGEKTITVADGTYELSDIVIEQNKAGKSLVVKAATAKGVTLKIPTTHTFPYIFMVNGCSSYDETRAITFNGFKFDVSAITSVDVAPVMNMSSKEDYSAIGYPIATTGHANDYGGYITIDNCELIGGNGSRNDKAVMYLASSGSSSKNITVKNSTLTYAGYLLATYVDGFAAENVITATPVKHFINNQTSGITMVGCTVNCDTDYAVRANAGPISITNCAFTMTYTGTDKGGIYVDRGANTQVTMSGNTYPASYAGANMHDVYNEKGGVCTISNGSETIATLNNGESYDFPRQ